MIRFLRTFIFLPALVTALVVLPSIAFSKGDVGISLTRALQGTISPLPTPGGTVPLPTATPTRQPYPTATRPAGTVPPVATVAPTATPVPAVETGGALINGVRLKKVIGDRLSSHIYGYISNGWLYHSPDDGRTWLLVTTQPAVADFVMSAADPNVLYSGTGVPCDGQNHPTAPMYKSIDGGVNWSIVPGAENLRPLLAHQGDVNSVFAVDCDGPQMSADGGATWVAKPDNSPDALWSTFQIVDMAVSSLLGDPRPTTPNWGQIFAGGVAEDGSGVIAFTNNMGETWVRLTPNVFPSSWGMNALAVDVATEGLITFAEPKSVWQTQNYGVNWQITTQGLGNVVDRGLAGAKFGLNDIAYHPNGRLYLATVRGLYSKPLTARNWDRLTNTQVDERDVTNLLYTETRPGVLWLNTTDGVYTQEVK